MFDLLINFALLFTSLMLPPATHHSAPGHQLTIYVPTPA
jgi:hypothetical protein